jgi:hypothetical protein
MKPSWVIGVAYLGIMGQSETYEPQTAQGRISRFSNRTHKNNAFPFAYGWSHILARSCGIP